MENENIEKKKSSRWLVAIPIVVILVVLGIYVYYFWLSNMPFNTNTVTTTIPATTSPPNNIDYTGQGTVLINETFTEFPHVIQKEFSEGLRIGVMFQSDRPIKFYMYDKQHYEQYQTGYYGSNKATTGRTPATQGSYRVDINNGEGGLYYFVFEPVEGSKASEGVLNVIEISKL